MPVADRAEADNDLLIRAVVAEGVDDLARDPTVTAQAFRAARGLVRMEPEGVTLESIVRDERPVVFTLEAGGALALSGANGHPAVCRAGSPSADCR